MDYAPNVLLLSGRNAARLNLIHGHQGPGRSRYFADVPIAFDGSGHPLAIARDSCVAYIAWPGIDDVSCRIHCGGISGTKRDGILALKILVNGIIPWERETTDKGGLTNKHRDAAVDS